MDLATKFAPYTDELFSQESKLSLLTNQDFDWINAETVKIYKVSNATMNDYDRRGTKNYYNRYGHSTVEATTELYCSPRIVLSRLPLINGMREKP